ncbi:MDR family MFS transporter [Parenemella sanctibonifatiensis]|uniref:MFS transporter n=1 Tax=Parenemella sanctibonifatiensis TaxID=2016505 RepID=A0A255E319_9ACTN|nr:MDR family MFS transporter [Parenemella sanctibonifatiensis]OYN85361.1 MFS transporter [Parenemella sanctibonifatiensis]
MTSSSRGEAVSRSTTDPAPPADGEFTGLGPTGMRVFIGLMLGMFVASISQTIVAPAMPRIVAELGGMDHYSWLATAAMMMSAVTVPVAGKLSDMYGRRTFFLGGVAIFMLGSVICGISLDFWMLVAGRAVQGLGMGVVMPLSQTIIGDIIPPRQRGKYQGWMGAVFGVSSVAGPLLGGFITDNLHWRALFFVTLPIGLIAFLFIARFLNLPHTPRKAKIDWLGIGLLAVTLVVLLLATSWGGTTYPWSSPVIIAMYAVGAVGVTAFIFVERRAEEPVIPLRLFRIRTVALAIPASFLIAVAMFGAIFYVPVYVQAVMQVSATESGLITMPMMIAMVLTGIVIGNLISRTGQYKPFMLGGIVLMLGAVTILGTLAYGDSPLKVVVAMLVFGLGLGGCMQPFLLVVQNVVAPSELGVGTAAVQFFRNVGSTVGVAVLGTVMTTSVAPAVLRHLPPGADPSAAEGLDAGAVLDPSVLNALPGPVAEAVRMGVADALHTVFLTVAPVLVIALILTAFIPHVTLRDKLYMKVESEKPEGASVDGQPAPAAIADAASAAASVDGTLRPSSDPGAPARRGPATGACGAEGSV